MKERKEKERKKGNLTPNNESNIFVFRDVC